MIALAVQDPLGYIRILEFFFFYEKGHWNFDTVLNLLMALGCMDILTY